MKFMKKSFMIAVLAVFIFAPAANLTLVRAAQAAGGNLISNHSLEESVNNSPLGWTGGYWGSLQASFTYGVEGYNSQKAVRVDISSYSSGDAKWYFDSVPVTAGKQYDFSDYYKSDVNNEIDIRYTMANGSFVYDWIGDLPAANIWQEYQATITIPANVTAISIFHLIYSPGYLVTDNFSLVEKGYEPPVLPVISISAPVDGTTVSGTIGLSAAVSAGSVTGIQFILDSSPFGALDTTEPYSIGLDTTVLSNGSHNISAQGEDTDGNIALAPAISITVNNITPPPPPPPPPLPIISITAPNNNDTVVGDLTISAGVSVTPVQGIEFLVDNNIIGSMDTSEPYSIIFDTASLSNGSHAIFAQGRDSDNRLASSAPIIITVNNTTPPPPPPPSNNLILNPSFEQGSGSEPNNWFGDGWGSNSAVFTYPVSGQEGARAARVEIVSYSSGDAKWYHDEVPVTAGKKYDFSDYYKSDTNSEIDVQYTMQNGSYQYAWINDLPAAASWQQYKTTLTIPANVAAISVFHLLYGTGYLATDNYSLVKHVIDTSNDFDEGMVSLTFDDGWKCQLSNAVPLMDAAGYKGSFFVVTADTLDSTGGSNLFITPNELLAMQANGYEIGNHTQTHPHLTQLSPSAAEAEIAGGRSDLLGIGLAPVTSFVYPYGEYNASVEQIVADTGHLGARSVDRGYNNKSTDKYALKIQEVNRNTTISEIEGWINTARANNSWLILMFHEVDYSGKQYSTTPEVISGAIDYLSISNTKVVTMGEGIGMMK